MKKFKITKEQIEQLYISAINEKNQLIESDLKNWFPNAFEKQLEVGKWYKSTEENDNVLYYLEKIKNKRLNGMLSYGFNRNGEWSESSNRSNNFFYKYTEQATPKEVAIALINEAKKRGFKANVNHTITNGDKIAYSYLVEDFGYDEFANKLLFNNFSIFDNGKWAEVIPLKITKEQIEEKLGYKIEIIELK